MYYLPMYMNRANCFGCMYIIGWVRVTTLGSTPMRNLSVENLYHYFAPSSMTTKSQLRHFFSSVLHTNISKSKKGAEGLVGIGGHYSPTFIPFVCAPMNLRVALCNPTKQLSPRAPVPYLTFGSHGWRRKIMVQIFGSQISHGCTAKGCSDPNPPYQP